MGGFMIIEHDLQWKKGEGCCCFDIYEDGISDGDGHPANYDDSFVVIEEEVYHKVIEMFRKAGNEIDEFGEKNSFSRNRDFQPKDCLYDGTFFFKIEVLSPCFTDSYVSYYGYDYYGLDMDDDLIRLEDFYDDKRTDYLPFEKMWYIYLLINIRFCRKQVKKVIVVV